MAFESVWERGFEPLSFLKSFSISICCANLLRGYMIGAGLILSFNALEEISHG